MRAGLIIATIADLGLALFLVALSGFVLEGVNNTGPMMPEAIFYVLFILLCLGAPALAWLRRRTLSPEAALGIAAIPLGLGMVALLVGPV
jgi:hypothetical membrane protein